MMKALAITDRGIEKVVLMELEELIGVKGSAEDKAVIFEPKTDEDLFRFCYFTQASERVMLLLGGFEFREFEDFIKKAEQLIMKTSLKEWFVKGCSFRVSCTRIGDHDFGSQNVDEDLGGVIISKVREELGEEPKVELDSPDIIIKVFINEEKAYIGIDLIGRDLSKRNYRIFTSPGVVNSTLSYSMTRLSGYDGKEKLVDFFCKSGVICIEAALHNAHISINKYDKDFAFKKIKAFERDWDGFFAKLDALASQDKQSILGLDPSLRNLEASKKNAKLAGVDKLITFSKLSLDWLDTKLDENTVDLVVSRVPCPSKHVSEGQIRKIYHELFYQAEFFMKKKARLCFLSENLTLFKEVLDPKFEFVKEEEVWAGKQRYSFMTIRKK